MLRFVVPGLFCALMACQVESGSIPPSDTGGQRDAASDARMDADTAPRCVARAELCNEADDDCDGTTDEGFDTRRDPRNCGGCGTRCPELPNGSPGCRDGACFPICDDGFADCDANASNGCETNVGAARVCP